MKIKFGLGLLVLFVVAGGWVYSQRGENPLSSPLVTDEGSGIMSDEVGVVRPHPLSIAALRQMEYPGSELVVEENLAPGSNYRRQVVSYESQGYKIFALLTVPNGEPPEDGWPVVVFNHGYISPSVYRTAERYVAYQDAFARNGYVTIKSDYRGHGFSEGEARGGYSNNDYTIDVMNAVGSVKRLPEVDSENIGMWGHSMGGHITLEAMVISEEIKAGVIWAGVVGSYDDLFNRWRNRDGDRPSPTPGGRGWWRYEMQEEYGDTTENPEFWESLSATAYLSEISGPVQLHHGSADDSVEVELSELLDERLRGAGREVELYVYPGDDHNISANLSVALARSVEFFDRYLKEE